MIELKDTFTLDTRKAIMDRDGHRCVCKCEKCDGFGHSIDHTVKNTQLNRKKYGNLIQSEANGNLMSEYCHQHCVSKEEMNTRRKWLTEKFDLLILSYPEIKNATQEQINVVMKHLDKFI